MIKSVRIVTPDLLKKWTPISVPRPMIEYASKYFGNRPLVGAEIGVSQGVNAKSILQTLKIEKLYLIDPYEPYADRGILCDIGFTFNEAVKRLSSFKDWICWIKKTSQDALQTFPNEFFDFVYIDGNHNYTFAKKDIEGYWKKVRKGGILGGHDLWGSYGGVVKAVVEFSNSINTPFLSEQLDYWFIKHVGSEARAQ